MGNPLFLKTPFESIFFNNDISFVGSSIIKREITKE